MKWIVAFIVAATAAVGLAYYATHRSESPAASTSSVRFREASQPADLTFHMSFLPQEQGETFKVNLYDHGCGVAVGDYDGDGHDDVYFLNQLGGNALYRNRGDGTFIDVTAIVGPVALDDRICVGATFSDYDNDGDQDLYVTSTRGGNVLFRNQGGTHFVDVTSEAGVELIAHSQTAAFFDYDGDGFLDLLVTNTAKWTSDQFNAQSRYYPGFSQLTDLMAAPPEYNVLYKNNRDGTFTDVTKLAGLKGRGWGGDVAIFDYDSDGHLDVLVTNMFGVSQLYRNDGDGVFHDVTSATLKRTSFGAIGSKVLDADSDGRLDLLIVDMHSDMWMTFDYQPASEEETRRKYPYLLGPRPEQNRQEEQFEIMAAEALKINYSQSLFGNTLFLNKGEGQFEEVSDKANLETLWPWGIATGDYDNDGYEDIYLPSGMGYPFKYWKSYLMMNQGNGTFADASDEGGIEPPPRGTHQEMNIRGKPVARSPRCAATADFDGDGRLDIVTNNFNDTPDYYRNESPMQNHISFRLTGTRSNRDAIGAVIRVKSGDHVMVRQVQAAGGYLSQSAKTVHFGLGKGQVDSAEIIWPSGQRQLLANLELNQRHDITEPVTATASTVAVKWGRETSDKAEKKELRMN